MSTDPLPPQTTPDAPPPPPARPETPNGDAAPIAESHATAPVPPTAAAMPAGSETSPAPATPVPPPSSPFPDAPPEVPPVEELKKKHFWAIPIVASMTGAAASILVHLCLIIVGIVLIPPLRQAVTNLVVQEQNVVPTAELATEQAGGIPNPGMNDEKTRSAAQNIDSSVTQSDSWSESKSETLSHTLTQGGTGDAVASTIGIGGGKTGAGTGLGTGAAGGGSLAKFGVPGGGSGIGPKGAVFGNGGNAYRIVFICDGTGTMMTKLPLLMRELKSTISKLKPIQEYEVIFFFDGEHFASIDPTKLLPATPPNNKKTFAFLDRFAVQGKTNPIPAIEQAFRYKPQLVYFLSDGAFDDLVPYDQVVARFHELNPDKAARVNTIVFINTQDRTEDLKKAEETMKKIAADSGGNFVLVDPMKLLTQ